MIIDTLLNSLGGCIAIFIISLLVLVKSADLFTSNSEKLGLMLGIPQYIVGVTIVSIGTSLPELATSLFSVYKGTSEFVIGNVIGSNIANILLIVGLLAVITKKVSVKWNLMHIDLPLLLASGLMLSIMAIDGSISIGEGILLLLGAVIFVSYTIHTHTKSNKIKKEEKEKIPFQFKVLPLIVVSAAVIYFSAKYTIDSVVAATDLPMFQALGIDTSIIALSAVAIGTSLPELIVSLSAAKKGNYEVAIGNVLGSNIFNTFFVAGVPALFGALVVTGSTLMIGIPVMLAATLLFVIVISDKQVSAYEGAVFLLIYAFFIGKLFGLL